MFAAQDVGEHREALAFLDEAHGDAGHVALERHARIHEREAAAAHRGHRGGAVRLRDLRHYAQRVGKFVVRRQDRMDGAPRELAVADFAPARRTHTARFAHRVRREIVVQHEMLAVLALERIDDLLVLAGAQRRHDQRLGLAAGEQRRTVGAGQDADFGIDVTDFVELAAIRTALRLQHFVAEDALLQDAEKFASFLLFGRIREELLGLLELRRITGPQPLIDPQQRLFVAGGRILGQAIQDQRIRHCLDDFDILQARRQNLVGQLGSD